MVNYKQKEKAISSCCLIECGKKVAEVQIIFLTLPFQGRNRAD